MSESHFIYKLWTKNIYLEQYTCFNGIIKIYSTHQKNVYIRISLYHVYEETMKKDIYKKQYTSLPKLDYKLYNTIPIKIGREGVG